MMPTYALRIRGSDGAGYYATVTTVTDGSGIYYGVDEPTYAYADIGLESAWRLWTIQNIDYGNGAVFGA